MNSLTIPIKGEVPECYVPHWESGRTYRGTVSTTDRSLQWSVTTHRESHTSSDSGSPHFYVDKEILKLLHKMFSLNYSFILCYLVSYFRLKWYLVHLCWLLLDISVNKLCDFLLSIIVAKPVFHNVGKTTVLIYQWNQSIWTSQQS